MLKVWIVSFFVFLGLVEIYGWLRQIALPLPVLILGGAALAIASSPRRPLPPQAGHNAASLKDNNR